MNSPSDRIRSRLIRLMTTIPIKPMNNIGPNLDRSFFVVIPTALMATNRPAVSMNARPIVSPVYAIRIGERKRPSMPVNVRYRTVPSPVLPLSTALPAAMIVTIMTPKAAM